MAPKLTPTQVKVLKEVLKLSTHKYQTYSCIATYKPALKLIELNLVQSNATPYGQMTLTITPEGEAEAPKYKDPK